MKMLNRWKIWVAMGLMALVIACAPRRNETQFAKNKIAETGQTYTEDQLRAALGSDKYDSLVAGIGSDNLNLLSYGIGITNMTQLVNGVSSPGKLTALMSDGPNSKKLNAIEILDLMNRLDDACQMIGSYGIDTIGKMVNMINQVTIAGMEGVKNIVHGVQLQSGDLNGAPYNNGTARLGMLISLLNETASVMPTLVNDLSAPRCYNNTYVTSGTCTAAGGSWSAAPTNKCVFPTYTIQANCVAAGHSFDASVAGGFFSASGNAKLIRLVNNSLDMRDLAAIINGTNNIQNITGVMAGLTGNVYCSKGQYYSPGVLNQQSACTTGGGTWSTNCSILTYGNRTDCEANAGTWTPDGIDNMGRIINELDRVCSNTSYSNGRTCLNNGGTWRTKASKIPIIINNITNVPNMYTIVNGLSNDGKRPQWPVGGVTVALPVGLGLPGPYAGDAGNAFDGVDSMVATLNKLYVTPADADSFGTEGMKRMAYLVNNLDTTPVYGNDSDFDSGTSCTTGQFDNRLNWAFSNNQTVTGSPWWGGSFASAGGTLGTHFQAGTCGLKNDNTAATVFTQTQSAELVANLTTGGTMSFQYRLALNTGDVVRFYDNDVVVNTYTSANNSASFANQTYAAASGPHRFRWDIQRALNSTGQMFLDTVILPADKGAARTAAEKTFIMMNNLYINSSLTNVADILSNVTAPACIGTPLTCTPTWNNGLDTLIHTVNRVEYPASIATPPRLAVTVNQITNLQVMYDILNSMPTQAATNQLIAMMDFVQTPSNLPSLINQLTGSAGIRIGDILKTLTAAGTVNMLRVLADAPTGAQVSDTATLINGVPNTVRVAEILNKLKLSSNVYSTTSSTVTFTIASPTVVTWTAGAHGLVQNARISFTSTVKLPSGINSGQVYYVCPINATTFWIADDLLCTAKRNATAANSGTHTALAGDETYFSTQTGTVGGYKLAQFFNRVNTVKTANSQNCAAASPNNFCIQNHLVRLVNDIATSASGSNTVAEIVSNLRPTAGPGTNVSYPSGATGLERMVDVLFDMRATNSVTPYTDPLSNGTTEDFGRLTAFIKDMTGAYAGLNTARMVNEVNLNYMSSRVTTLLRTINRMRYLSRLLSEMTSVDLMLALLNDSTTNISRIETLVDRQGDLTYGTAAIGSFAGPFYGASFTVVGGCTEAGCDTSTADKLGRLIVLINQVDAVTNVVKVVNQTYDLNFLTASTATFSYGATPKTDGSGYGFINAVNRITYLSELMNGVTNIDLLLNIINGDGSANMSTGVNYDIMIKTVNNVGGSQRKGAACTSGSARVSAEDPTNCSSRGGTWNTTYAKNVGNVSIITGIINDLGWDSAIPGPRTMAEQMRVVNVFNNVKYCGIIPNYDRDTSPGSPVSEYYGCDTDVSYNYVKGTDIYDRRHRVSNVLLGMKSSQAMAIIVGDVAVTQKTIDVMNGSRRINTIIKTVDWLPGEATADLLNYTNTARINTGLVYLVNNLDPDEDIAAKAFVQMIHWGVDLPTNGCGSGSRNCGCVSFRAIGPKRLAGVLNTEYGPYLESILTMFGWRTAIPALVCGFGTTQASNGSCPFLSTSAQNQAANFVTSGTAVDGTTCSAGAPCQDIVGGITTVRFPRQETLAIVANPTPSGAQGANGATYTHTYSANSAANCTNYFPEQSGALGINKNTDDTVWTGLHGCFLGVNAANVPAGIGGVWGVLKGQGFVGWLIGNGGTLGTPPLTGGAGSCTGSGSDEWSCIKQGKDDNDGADNIAGNSDDNVSYYRWGNYCSLPGYSSAGTCEGAGGRWMPNKNYSTCQVNPDTDGPR